MRFSTSALLLMDSRMGNFMDVSNQKSMWIQVGVNGDERLPLWNYPEIAQPCPARLDHPEGESILLPEISAILGRCCR